MHIYIRICTVHSYVHVLMYNRCYISNHICVYTYVYVGSDRPQISELCEYVRIDVAPQWYDLGMQLLNGEQAKKLNVIQSDHPGDSEKCCTAMFNYWLQVDTTASWDKLIMALIHIGKHVLADTIKKMTTEEGIAVNMQICTKFSTIII